MRVRRIELDLFEAVSTVSLSLRRIGAVLAPLALLGVLAPASAAAAPVVCARNITANVVAIDSPIMFNRLGAQNPNWIIYALAHDVVPVVLWDPLEFTVGASRGLLHARDPESGQRRLVWWRLALRETWQRAHDARRDALKQIFAAQRLRPLFVEGDFDADAVTRHFYL